MLARGTDAGVAAWSLATLSGTQMLPWLFSLVAALTLCTLPVQAQTDSATSGSAGPAPGVLLPGDYVRVQIWREPDLSGDFMVDEAGTVTLPKIGAVSVTNLPVESLKNRLLASYETYLRNPSITVVPLRRINVSGAVRKPGLYNIDPTMTIADALAVAGGVGDDGKPDKVELIRGGQRLSVALTAKTPIRSTPLRAGDQLFVPQRGWMSRNPWVVAAAITAAASLVVNLAR
jgi:protein involved in polysaccharide export with SLBB domain